MNSDIRDMRDVRKEAKWELFLDSWSTDSDLGNICIILTVLFRT